MGRGRLFCTKYPATEESCGLVNGRRVAGDEEHRDGQHTATLHIAVPVNEDAELFLQPTVHSRLNVVLLLVVALLVS